MRKVKSTALLGAFVAVASVGAISHEAHGTNVTSIINTIANEALPKTSVSLPTPYVTPSVNYPSNASVTLILSGASFVNGDYYAILGAGSSTLCYTQASHSGLNSLTLGSSSGCSLTANASYTIVGGTSTPNQGLAANTTFVVSVPQGPSSIVLSYSSNVGNDTPSSVTLAKVVQQLTVTPTPAATATIDPNSLSTFNTGSNVTTDASGNDTVAYNSMTISSVPLTDLSLSINSDTLYVAFNGIPSSVSSISTTFTNTTNVNDTASTIAYTQGTGSATVSLTLPDNGAVFTSPYSNTASFSFYNTGDIQSGTIYISSIQGQSSAGVYSYFSGSRNFLSFINPSTEIYIPDALVSDSNAINYSYLTISMPPGATISSISALNTGVSCSVSSISLTHTGTTGVYYMDLSQLVQACPGISSTAWQSGVPLVITISGSNVGPNNVTADAYAVFGGMLKRIPVNVINGNGLGFFSY